MKIMIAIPCMDQVPVLFMRSLVLLQKPDNCTLALKQGSLVYTSRNELAIQAIESESDLVFWVDSDMTFQPDTLLRMIDVLTKNNLDILTALCFRRVKPYTPTLFDKLEIKGEAAEWTEFRDIPNELFEVGGCGLAGMLMKTDVFFDVQNTFGNMFAPIGNNGEDVAFCWRARQCGYHIYCDPTIVFGHVGNMVIDDHFYKAFRGTS